LEKQVVEDLSAILVITAKTGILSNVRALFFKVPTRLGWFLA